MNPFITHFYLIMLPPRKKGAMPSLMMLLFLSTRTGSAVFTTSALTLLWLTGCSCASWRAVRRQKRTVTSGRHTWPRRVTSERWAPRCRSHGQIHQQSCRGRRPAGNRCHGPRRVAGPGRAPGTVSGGGAEVLRAAHQRGAGMGGVLPVLQRAQAAPPADGRSQPGEGPVLHPPAPGRNRVAAARVPARR